jgi:hypothetical protein
MSSRSSSPKWRDSTSYAQGEGPNKKPRSWTLGDDHLWSIILYIDRDTGLWCVSVYGLGVRGRETHTDDLELAKRRAGEIVQAAFVGVTNKLGPLIDFCGVKEPADG